MKPTRISLGEFSLEAIHHPGRADTRGGVVLCHPHPQFGGDMDNPIVVAIEQELVNSGWCVLKFNFRGTGRSGGEYGGGAEEIADVLAAVDYLHGQEGDKANPLYVVGYSFGAAVGLQACLRSSEIAGFAGVALPPTMFPLEDVENYTGSFFAIVGNRDSFVPLARVQEAYQLAPGPKDMVVLPDCDHFFFGLEDEVAGRVCEMLGKDRIQRLKSAP